MRKTSPRKRRPLTKAQLLPLPADQVQRLSLKHHLALVSLRDGHGDLEVIGTLLHVLYLAYFLRNASDADPELYPRAEAVLDQCVARAERGESWALTDGERVVIVQLVVAHDAQLGTVPAHRYLEAWERVVRVTAPGARSPIREVA
ncbi:hypothetical protein [Burkholderia ubonensis]|uniref:Fis family transcriptional regulator n=1 Tax=Burkholderia ubonensis TaxID=101571 RepID=A0A107FF30_9BURK|nr:hypothetical protein [Burkholderia ubonensis]KWD85129.1 hypothetical protein WL70_13745 [Burkholderia ubonensis]KWD92335.1 hypothetical protein WL71_03460 [Burkholderia ubonensis]KWD94176.1 hypothetical protein WL72_26120 [Burkholderia ubonensis]KWD97055.1 hypothetical protein WL73_21665 [Burkholderia ubonensis]